MNVTKSTMGESEEDTIQTILQLLKTRIDRYDPINEDAKSKEELPRIKRIEKLMMEERRLSEENEKIRKQLKHYEKRYEKALKKKVKVMKIHLEDDQQKLEVMKQRCQELDKALGANHYTVGKPKKIGKQPKVNRAVIKVRTMKPKSYRQTTLPLSKKIKIKISRNEELGNREMHFVNGDNTVGNGQSAFTDLVNIVQPMKVVDTRECRIMLQRLTEEQMKLYKNQQQPEQTPKNRTKKQRVTASRKVNQNRLSTIQPRWHIKMPKSVYEECQKEIGNSDLDPVIVSNDTI